MSEQAGRKGRLCRAGVQVIILKAEGNSSKVVVPKCMGLNEPTGSYICRQMVGCFEGWCGVVRAGVSFRAEVYHCR